MEDYKFIKTHFTKNFIELKPLIERHKIAQKEMRKCDKKLKTFEATYSFLNTIIKQDCHDSELGEAIKILFKKAGFSKVIHFRDERKGRKREDLQLWHEEDIFIVEVKGIKSINPAYRDLTQVLPYFKSHQRNMQDKNVFGLSIISHDNKSPVFNRKWHYYSREINDDLKNCDLSTISVIDLLVHFMKLKEGKIDFLKFKNNLKYTGVLTYDSKGGKTLEK